MQLEQMKEPQDAEACRIYFPETVFGKATKSRKEDPSMFDLLSWNPHGFDQKCFKRNEKFESVQQTYLNMIGRQPWTTQFQQNFQNFNCNSIAANREVLSEIENYIIDRTPHVCKKKEGKEGKEVKNNKKEKKEVDKVIEKKQRKVSQNNQIQKQERKLLSIKIPSQKHIYVKSQPNLPQSPEKKYSNSGIKEQKNTENEILQKLKSQQSNIQRSQRPTTAAAVNSNSRLYTSNKKLAEISPVKQQQLIKQFRQTTRWIPNSSFTTYFGKPPFQNYGRGNTKPIDGGLVYGTYLYSHNVQPHRGKNVPANLQSYPEALRKAHQKGDLVPEQPRTKTAVQVSDRKGNWRKIDPQANGSIGLGLTIEVPDLKLIEKFGGKGKGSQKIK